MEPNTPDIPIPKKPGPNGEHKWAEKVVRGIVVGRNKIVIPPEEVEHLASLGCSDRDIATYFDVHENTLRYNFKEFLTKGRHQLKITLRQAQLRAAIENLNPTLLIWLGKNLLNQNENGQDAADNRALPWNDDPVAVPSELDMESEESNDEESI
jgi:hypothetical protein